MQTGEEVPEALQEYATDLWRGALNSALTYADTLHDIGNNYCDMYGLPEDHPYRGIKIHKSLPNRLLEPFAWITTVITATEWNNFYRLRCHGDAEVHFRKIAEMIRDARAASTPVERQVHLPFLQRMSMQWLISALITVGYLTTGARYPPRVVHESVS